jgi:hypothetical protein
MIGDGRSGAATVAGSRWASAAAAPPLAATAAP